MTGAAEHPWFHTAVQLLDPRAKDRVLAFACTARETEALAHLVGTRGELTVVYEDRRTAEAIADRAPAHVEVAVRRLDGSERFGAFDAMLAAPAWGPLPGTLALGQLARHNLRPGGRCVVDLPAPEMLPELAGAAIDLGWPREHLAALRGVADDELAAAMHDAGLRGVHSLLATHLLHVGSPLELVDRFAAALPVTAPQRVELAHAIVRRRGSPAGLDALVHRTRLQAQR
ncbi:MAG: hypothetical protein JNM25_06825 [Planctomycetes bacterium]|nr:hypothetical protein [Planctomycetota bacterium]